MTTKAVEELGLAEDILECKQADNKQADKWIGTMFSDRYQILAPVGEGGMGLVYKAKHVLMNRLVAIKIIRAELLSNVTLIHRFKQEAMAVSKLNHPNIVTVYDFGVTPEEGTPFLVMDYLDGESLSQRIANQRLLPQAVAVPVFIQACRALEHAHQKGIIHRDLKSSNLMLVRNNDVPDFVKVVDFGMAKLMRPDDESTEFQELTQTGDVFGSPLYMSPEQCRGQKLDERSDIYSLGCVMYYTLSGQPPCQGDNVLDTLQRQIYDNPIALTRLTDIPSALNEVVMKALRKEPDSRYQSMSDMIKDLSAVGDGGSRVVVTQTLKKLDIPIHAEKQADAQSVHEKTDRKRYGFLFMGHNIELTVAFGVFCALIIAVTAYVTGRIAEEADTSQGANLWTELNQAGDEERAAGKFAAAENSYKRAMIEALKGGPRNPRLAKSYLCLGATYAEDKQFQRSEVILKKAVDVLEDCYGPDCPELSTVLVTLARTYEQQGRSAEAKALRLRAIALLENAGKGTPRRKRSAKKH
jgi:tRNA A-37 threonylcarbamoyl transferase component Bud32/tetratricopeptide (TPR) repeat protein